MTEERIKQRYQALSPFLDEKQRRLLAGAEAIAYGVGGQKRVATLLGLSQGAVSRGVQELRQPETVESDRIRQPGGGRKPAIASDPELWTDLERLVSPTTRGDPESPLRWTLKSTRKLATELNALKPGRGVSTHLVSDLLHEMGYSLQANRKTLEGSEHPDRDAKVPAHQRQGAGIPTKRSAGNLRRHKEERARRGFQERGPGMAAHGAARTGARPRFQDP